MEHADILCVPARGIAASVRLLRRQRLRNISSVSNRSIGGKDPLRSGGHDAQNLCRLAARGLALRVEDAVAALEITSGAAIVDGLKRPIGDGVEVSIGQLDREVLADALGKDVITIEDLGQLLTVDRVGGLEGAVGIAANDAVCRGPQNGLFIIGAVLAVLELLGDLALDVGRTRHT